MDSISEIKTLRDKEKELLQKALAKTNWNLDAASRLLQISLARLRQKIREHGLERSPVP